jgi:hypothetical protein
MGLVGNPVNKRKPFLRQLKQEKKARLLTMDSREPIPQERRGALVETTQEFADRLNALYGLYLDATTGFEHNADRIKEAQEETAHLVSDRAELDQAPIFYGRGDPNDPNNVVQHQTTQGEYKARNSPGGSNFRLLSYTLIVFAFHLWEQEYRPRIAKLLGIETNALTLPIFGDLRHLRNEILKHRGVLTERVSNRLEVISGLEVGQDISFADAAIEQLVHDIKAALDDTVQSATGTDPKLRTMWHISQ